MKVPVRQDAGIFIPPLIDGTLENATNNFSNGTLGLILLNRVFS
jgi:hypothetical protein